MEDNFGNLENQNFFFLKSFVVHQPPKAIKEKIKLNKVREQKH